MTSCSIKRLGASDLEQMRALNALFARAFEDPEHYTDVPPSDDVLARKLALDHVIVLVAHRDGVMVGGLVAYELEKLEQDRSEIYIYDLGVEEEFRRQGIATALIGHLQQIGRERGAWTIYVQADYGDDPAISLYQKLGVREDVMHFDIPVE